MVSVCLERRSITRAVNQPCLCTGAPVKPLNTGLSRLPWLVVICVDFHMSSSTRKGLGSSAFDTCPDSALWTLFPTNFILCPFPMMNCTCEYSSVRWALWALLGNYRAWGWIKETPKVAAGVRNQSGLRNRPGTLCNHINKVSIIFKNVKAPKTKKLEKH